SVLVGFHRHLAESNRLESGGQPVGFDRQAYVAHVQLPELVAVEAVGAGQHSAGPQHSRGLGEEPVLVRLRGQVVKHGERHHGTEAAVVVGQLGGASLDHFDAGGGHPRRQVGGEIRIQLGGTETGG